MVAQRIKEMTPSATSMLAGKINEMRAMGEDIASFNLGEPDFPTPSRITEACFKALEEGHTKYSSVAGILPLRKAIAEKLEKENHISTDVSCISISTGAKQAIYNAVLSICNPGDEVIIPTPCWVSYVEMVKLAQAIPVLVATKEDFQLDIPAVEKKMTDRTRLIIINNPNNPTGASYSRESLMRLAEIAVEHDCYVLSDEVYEKLVYQGQHISIASLFPEVAQRTVTVNGFSKAYSMTGWRLGYAAGPADIISAMIALQGHCTSNTTTFVQYAGITALKECEKDIEDMRKEFLKRRDYMFERLTKIKDVYCPKPEGAFYLMPDIRNYFGKTEKGTEIKNSFDFCDYMLSEARVAIVPGDAFYMPGTVRFAYSVSMDVIEAGLDRFEAVLGKIHQI